jgi:hypothetical protein
MISGGRKGKTVVSVVASEGDCGAIFGGNRRTGATGVRVGRTMRTVSPFALCAAAPVS